MEWNSFIHTAPHAYVTLAEGLLGWVCFRSWYREQGKVGSRLQLRLDYRPGGTGWRKTEEAGGGGMVRGQKMEWASKVFGAGTF